MLFKMLNYMLFVLESCFYGIKMFGSKENCYFVIVCIIAWACWDKDLFEVFKEEAAGWKNMIVI